MAADNLKQCLAFGVTAVIDMFMSPQAMKAIKTAQSSAEPPPQAFLVSPGILCTVPGGHGTQFGLTIPTIEAGTDLQAFVDARIAEGADFIKLIQDDFSSYGMKRPTLTKDQVAGLIQAAHARGKIAVHPCGDSPELPGFPRRRGRRPGPSLFREQEATRISETPRPAIKHSSSRP